MQVLSEQFNQALARVEISGEKATRAKEAHHRLSKGAGTVQTPIQAGAT